MINENKKYSFFVWEYNLKQIYAWKMDSNLSLNSA